MIDRLQNKYQLGVSSVDILELTMRIYIYRCMADKITLDVTETTTILEIKLMVLDKAGIPADKQRLIFAGKNLEDNKSVRECGIVNEVRINLVEWSRGG